MATFQSGAQRFYPELCKLVTLLDAAERAVQKQMGEELMGKRVRIFHERGTFMAEVIAVDGTRVRVRNRATGKETWQYPLLMHGIHPCVEVVE